MKTISLPIISLLRSSHSGCSVSWSSIEVVPEHAGGYSAYYTGGAGVGASSYKSFIGAKVHCNGREGGRSTGFILESCNRFRCSPIQLAFNSGPVQKLGDMSTIIWWGSAILYFTLKSEQDNTDKLTMVLGLKVCLWNPCFENITESVNWILEALHFPNMFSVEVSLVYTILSWIKDIFFNSDLRENHLLWSRFETQI